MVTEGELRDDEEYAEILEDVKEEAGKYGELDDGPMGGVRIPRPQKKDKKWSAHITGAAIEARNRMLDEQNGVGRVYVKYKDSRSTQKAMEALGGRQFGGRTILVASVPEVRPSYVICSDLDAGVRSTLAVAQLLICGLFPGVDCNWDIALTSSATLTSRKKKRRSPISKPPRTAKSTVPRLLLLRHHLSISTKRQKTPSRISWVKKCVIRRTRGCWWRYTNSYSRILCIVSVMISNRGPFVTVDHLDGD